MLQHHRIDVSERIDINKTSKLKKCMLCHYWCFKDIGYKFQPCLCNGYHAVSMMTYELKNMVILNAKGVDYRCILWGISRDGTVNRLNNSVLEDKGVLQMDFGANKTPVDQLKNIDPKYYCSDYYDVSVIKYDVKCGTSLRFWENKGWINEIDPYGWF